MGSSPPTVLNFLGVYKKALSHHLVDFSRQIAKIKFQLKSTILYDIAYKNLYEGMKDMKQITAVVVGYGNRGQVYSDYSLSCPEELKIVGIVDPSEFKLKESCTRYGLSEK